MKTHQAITMVPRVLFVAALLLMAAIAPQQTGAAEKRTNEPWGVIVVGQQSEAERLATLDLQRYLGQTSGRIPAVVTDERWRKRPVNALILGTPETNKVLADLKPELAPAGQEGYLLEEKTLAKNQLVLAAGQTPQGAVQAVYGLLRELGYGFYLGSEAVPERLPEHLAQPRLVRAPALKIRGVLPWYNFFNSPTTWDPIDHRAFVDQLTRMGANFVGFHTYDAEPFAAYEKNGKMVWGERLLNTATSTWGTHPMPSSEYSFGTSQLFAQKYFGADSTISAFGADAAIRLEQNIMRDALDYAHRRGLKTCLGFEVNGDPTKPEDREIFLARINHVLEQYPALDYLWIWQPESQGIQGFRTQYAFTPLSSALDPKSLLVNYGLARRDIFRRVVENPSDVTPQITDKSTEQMARAIEGARLEQFGLLASHALAHRSGAPRLVISGWGGDDRCLSSEYYEALDKLLPKDVIFSSLEYISPRERIDSIYSELPKDRERWPIPWLENDGDQWHPQPFVHIYEKMMKNVHKSGSQGVLGIHWRTRDVEENFAYLMDSAWQPSLSADQFFADLARRCYGPEIAAPMGEIHNKLDELGYRWAGGSGQPECGVFIWGIGDEAHRQALASLRTEAMQLLPQARRGKDRLQWLINNMSWVLQYEQAQIAAIEAKQLLAQAGQKQAESPEAAKALAQQALDTMQRGNLAQALQTFAQRVSTRGEYGVLATINTKAVWEWRSIRAEAQKVLGQPVADEPTPQWDVNTPIQLPRFLGSATAGRSLELSPIVMNDKPAWLHYRTLGQRKWQTLPLKSEKGWVRTAAIPAAAMKEPGIEIGFSSEHSAARPMVWGPVTVTVMPSPDSPLEAPGTVPVSGTAKLLPSVHEGKTSPIELTWNDILAVDYYRVLRNGQPVIETVANFLPDYPDRAAGHYVVEAWREGKVIAQSDPVRFVINDQPFSEEFKLTTSVNQGGVNLSWPQTLSPAVTSYRVQILDQETKTEQSNVLGLIPASRTSGHAFHHTPNKGQWIYRVTPLNAAGREAAPVTVEVQFPPKPVTTPALDLPLTQKPEGAQVFGNVAFDAEGARFFGGYMSLPHNDGMNMGNGMTLTYEFMIERLDNEPVIMSHGIWHGDGWYTQVLGGHLLVKMPGMDTQGPKIEPGQWYKVHFVFDGTRVKLAVNGQWIPQAEDATVNPMDTARPMLFGQYESMGDRYTFIGRLRNVKIYPDVLMELSQAR